MNREQWLVAKFKRESEMDLTPEMTEKLVEYFQYQRNLALREVIDTLDHAKLFSAVSLVETIR